MQSIFSASLFAALTLCLAPNVHANGCNNHPPCPPPPPTLHCDAGGPYTVDSQMGVVSVQLDGTDSAGATSWHWSTNQPGAFFDDANVPNPVIAIPVTCDCSFNVSVSLTVRRDNQTKTCCATIRLRDHIRPIITCPEDGKIISGQDESPAALGCATATDNCDAHVQISYHDHIVQPDCPADRFDYVIERKWKAVDNDCNKATCVQNIDVVKKVAALDILPGACPNTYNRTSSALLPVAILGDFDFDVTQIQWNTVRMYGLDCAGGPVSAHSFQLADAATTFAGTGCGCHDLNGDGRLDLVANFKRNQLNNGLGLCNLSSGTAVQIVVIGRLCNGSRFIAQDCLVVQ